MIPFDNPERKRGYQAQTSGHIPGVKECPDEEIGDETVDLEDLLRAECEIDTG
jgi:hypothetical protein